MAVGQRPVAPGESVDVVATVANPANESRSFTVELTMFDEVVAVRDVPVPAGETRTVAFAREIQAPGEYDAVVGNDSATVVVEDPSATGSGTTDAADVADPDDTAAATPLGTLLPLVALAAALALAMRRS